MEAAATDESGKTAQKTVSSGGRLFLRAKMEEEEESAAAMDVLVGR